NISALDGRTFYKIPKNVPIIGDFKKGSYICVERDANTFKIISATILTKPEFKKLLQQQKTR
ncbi:MAG: hypothetical protein GX944_01920, partial [Alphaproteobacteria bacterium]|nr:hypothetical protein [Alphaproteobacteria bacterium]